MIGLVRGPERAAWIAKELSCSAPTEIFWCFRFHDVTGARGVWFHYSSAPQQFLQCHKAHANMGLDELGGGGPRWSTPSHRDGSGGPAEW